MRDDDSLRPRWQWWNECVLMSLLDIGCILEADLTCFPNRLDVKYTQQREKFTITPRFFSGHLKQ